MDLVDAVYMELLLVLEAAEKDLLRRKDGRKWLARYTPS